MSNTTKIPCGGFYLGDGLTMDGNTLKSLGGAYVKVNSNDGQTFEFADDSPLKTFEEIKQKIKTSFVTVQMTIFNVPYATFSLQEASVDLISFYVLSVNESENKLKINKLFINSDNTITLSMSEYTLTPAT